MITDYCKIDYKKDALLLVIVAWSLCFVFFLGRLSFYYEIVRNRPAVEVVSDSNLRVPVFYITAAGAGFIRVKTNFDNARVAYKDDVALIGTDQEFEIKLE
ncbi:hypothetical protein KKG71_04395 [Patescibacteria group bacterium]|nr:hypothetical protein [Patescibacteria group bacterium]